MRRISAKPRAAHLVGEMLGILAPLLLTVAVAVLALRLLNAVPAHWQRLTGGPPPAPPVLAERLQFSSIEEAEAELGVRALLPAYFPSSLAWPPASVRGQREPARVVSLLFLSADGRQALQIREVFSPEEALPFPLPEPVEVLERRDVAVNGVVGLLLLGRGQDGAAVNQVRWRHGGAHLVVTTIYPPEELLRIAESMHPE
ncbi:MAG: hypothetical protein ACM3US_00980 [Sphingomonadaceae bacterium]